MPWIERSESVMDYLDGAVLILFALAAIFGLLAMFRISSVLAGVAGTFLGLAMFSMAAMLWIDQELSKFFEQVGGDLRTSHLPPIPAKRSQPETMG